MPKVVREGDSLSTGHGCDTETTIDTANQLQSAKVYANDEIINVVGAPTINHPFPPNPPCAPHTAYLNAGAPNVYINNIKVGRFGDSADAGAMLEPPGVTVYAGNA